MIPRDRRVGVPRVLAYDELREFFDALLEAAGMIIAVSPRSSKTLLDAGAARSVDDVCMPLKLSFGHIHALVQDGIEVVLVPRLVSVAKGRNFCPKLHVLPDLVRSAFPGLQVLAPYIDFHHSRREELAQHLEDACAPMLWQLGVPRRHFRTLVARALSAKTGENERPEPTQAKTDAPVIAVLGHPYAELDPLCGLDIPRSLRRLGARVVLSPSQPPLDHRGLGTDIYYEPTHRTARAAAYHIASGVDGIVLMTFFACGPDSYGAELLMYRLTRLAPHLPVLRIIADEQSAAEGLATRLETFVDIVRDGKKRRQQC
jgi:predicted nucleotide-binding protein (sugar kinase/HSP70/actin superfamily)